MFRKSAAPKTQPSNAVTTTGPCRRALRLRVSSEMLAPIRAAVLSDIQKQATLPGFRKGKAPAELIEKRYAESLQQETVQRATQQAFEQAVKDHQLKPVGPIEVQRAEYHQTDGLALEATVEVEPEFALTPYKKMPLTRPTAEVTPDDVAKALAQLQESMAQMVPPAQSQQEPPALALSTGAPGGQAAPVKERQVPALDQELAKDLGFETLEALRAHVEAKLAEQKRTAQTQALEAALCETLLARHRFEVPSSLVQHQTQRLTRDFTVRLLMAGKKEEDVSAEVGKFTEQLRTNAERLVKLSCIMDRIAQQEQIDVTQDELVARLWQLSQRWKKDPAEVRKILDAQRLWPSVVSTIRQEKTVTWLLEAAEITNGAPSKF
jgi:trigger factor